MKVDVSRDKDKSIYTGVVISNKDPMKLGRVKVRIPNIWGTKEQIADEYIPWAKLLSSSAGADSGSFIVPEVGSSVYVTFENGDHEFPIIIGAAFSAGRETDIRQIIKETKGTGNDDKILGKLGEISPDKRLKRNIEDTMKQIKESKGVKDVYTGIKNIQHKVEDFQNKVNTVQRQVQNYADSLDNLVLDKLNIPKDVLKDIDHARGLVLEVQEMIPIVKTKNIDLSKTLLGTPILSTRNVSVERIVNTRLNHFLRPYTSNVSKLVRRTNRDLDFIQKNLSPITKFNPDDYFKKIDQYAQRITDTADRAYGMYKRGERLYNDINSFIGKVDPQKVSNTITKNLKIEENSKEGRVVKQKKSDIPTESINDIANRIVYKSPKGAKVMMSENDSKESVIIEDVNGQKIQLISPLKEETIPNQTFKTNTDKASNLKEPSKIIIKNPFKDEINIESDGKTSHFNIAIGATKRGIEIDSKNKFIRVFSQESNKMEFIIDDSSIAMKSEGAMITIKGGKISISGSNIDLNAPTISLKASSLNLSGSGINMRGNISSNSNLTLPRLPHFSTVGGSGGGGSAPSVSIKDWEYKEEKEENKNSDIGKVK